MIRHIGWCNCINEFVSLAIYMSVKVSLYFILHDLLCLMYLTVYLLSSFILINCNVKNYDFFLYQIDSHSMNGTINDPIEDGDTALHLCCLYGYLPCVQVGYFYCKFYFSVISRYH